MKTKWTHKKPTIPCKVRIRSPLHGPREMIVDYFINDRSGNIIWFIWPEGDFLQKIELNKVEDWVEFRIIEELE